MFKYRIIQGKQIIDGFEVENTLFETKNRKDILEKYQNLEKIVEDAEKNAIESVKERKKIVEENASDFSDKAKYEFVYANTIVRSYIDKSQLPDEYLMLEVEYTPVDELIEEIEKEIRRKIKKVDKSKPIYLVIDEKRKRIHLKQLKKGKVISILTTTKFNDKLLTLFEILQEITTEA